MPSGKPWNHNIHYFPWIVSRAASIRPESVVDVGSGDGMLAAELARVAPRVLAIDIDPRQIEACRNRFSTIPNLTFEVGDLLGAAPSQAPFDVVVSSATVHHMPLDKALHQLAALTAPGGLMLIVGLARDGSALDVLRSGWKVVPVRLARAIRGWHDHGSTRHDPVDSWSEVAATVERILPGAVFSRRFYWRYSVEWRKPR